MLVCEKKYVLGPMASRYGPGVVLQRFGHYFKLASRPSTSIIPGGLLEFGILAISMLVFWGYKWPYLEDRV